MRAFLSSAMAILVIAALFWGNCLSCPQVLSSLTHHRPSHGCCPKSQQAPADCQSQVLSHFVKADPGTSAPTFAVVGTPEIGFVPSLSFSAPSAPAAVYSPPDPLALNSALRI